MTVSQADLDLHNWLTAEAIVRIAQGEIGVREATDRNDGIPAERYHDGRTEAWCGAFVRWVHEQALNPIHGSHTPGARSLLSWVQHLEMVFRKHHHWRSVTSDYEPQRGDVVFWLGRDQSDPGRGRHVSIVESVQYDARALTVISGNWRHQVARHVVLWSPAVLTGAGWV